MGEISSFHIEPSKDNNTVHNDRTISPTYLLKHNSLGVEVDNHAEAADELFRQKYLSAVKSYTERTKQSIQAKKIKWSAVVNITEKTTMKDLKKLTGFLEEKYGWQCYQIAIHRDEGYTDKDTGETKYNLHAHLEFLMLNKQGIYCFKKRDFGKKKLATLQNEIAEILGMQRGESIEDRLKKTADKLGVQIEEIRQKPKEKYDDYVLRIQNLAKSKGFEDFNIFAELKARKGLTHQQYKQEKRDEDKIKTALNQAQSSITKLNRQVLTLKEQKKQIEAERKKYKDEGEHIAEDYRKLQALNKTLHTQEELDKALAELRKQYEDRLREKEKEVTDLINKTALLTCENVQLQDSITDLRLEKDATKQNNAILSLENQNLKKQNNKIEQENNKYKEENERIAEDFRKFQEQNNVQHVQEELDRTRERIEKYEADIKKKKRLINIYDETLSKVAETAETEEREDGSYSFQSVIISVLKLKSDKTQLSNELKKVEKERDDWKNVCKHIFKGLGIKFSETAERCRELFDFYKSKFKQFFNKEDTNSSSFENRLAKEMGYPSEEEEEEKRKLPKFHRSL